MSRISSWKAHSKQSTIAQTKYEAALCNWQSTSKPPPKNENLLRKMRTSCWKCIHVPTIQAQGSVSFYLSHNSCRFLTYYHPMGCWIIMRKRLPLVGKPLSTISGLANPPFTTTTGFASFKSSGVQSSNTWAMVIDGPTLERWKCFWILPILSCPQNPSRSCHFEKSWEIIKKYQNNYGNVWQFYGAIIFKWLV